MLDAEELKDIYNKNYKKKVDNWSETSLKRTDFIAARLLRYLKSKKFVLSTGSKCLDIGCAKGHHTESFRRKGFESHGLDYSDVAIEIASKEFDECKFFVADGFEPKLKSNYDLIFMKGFSGTNTTDLNFVANLCTKYCKSLNEKGWFVLSFTSNFSGIQKEGETVNWSKEQIESLASKIPDLELIEIKFFNRSSIYRFLRKILTKGRKDYFYLMFRKQV